MKSRTAILAIVAFVVIAIASAVLIVRMTVNGPKTPKPHQPILRSNTQKYVENLTFTGPLFNFRVWSLI